jgi:ketosteroid isomerase-like protein
VDPPVTLQLIDAQEERFAGAFSAGDVTLVRDLYHPDVVYLSPTTRLFGGPRRIERVEQHSSSSS